MLQIDLWKRVIIWAVVAVGLILALPNLFYGRVEIHNDALAAIEAQGGVATPEQEAESSFWPSFLPSGIVNLGLDLRGGAHLLAEVHVEDVYADRMDALWPEVRNALRAERATIGAIRRQDSAEGELRVRIGEPAQIDRAVAIVRDLARPIVSLTGVGASDIDVIADGAEIVVQLSEAEKQATDSRTVQQASRSSAAVWMRSARGNPPSSARGKTAF